MKVIARLWRSSLGRKYLVAITGIALWLFVIGHLVGNLQFFAGPQKINVYAAFLKSQPELIWGVRLGLLLIVGIHIFCAIKLASENRAARPIPYGSGISPYAASYASRTMVMSGIIIGLFVVYHLLHYTLTVRQVNLTGVDFGELHETLKDGSERHNVYRMMILGFRQPVVSGFYLVAVGLLSLHLSHGLSAMFQSLGISRFSQKGRDKFAKVVGLLIFLGYASIPGAILLGFGKELAK